MEDQGEKQFGPLKALKPGKNKENIKSIERIFPKDMRTNELKNETDKIKKYAEETKRKKIKYKAKNWRYNFTNMKQ